MLAWRDKLASDIPIEIPGELLDTVEEAWEVLEEEVASVQYTAERLDALRDRLLRFDSCADTESYHILDVWQIYGEGPPFDLCLFTRSYTVSEGRAMTPVTRYECRMLGLFELGSDVGRVLIRPESIGDKILELFRRREVDFPECPDFCGSYYVLANKEAALREGLSQEVLDHLGSRKDLFIEIVERDMLLLWSSVINARSVVEATDFLLELAVALAPESASPYR